MQFFIVGGGVRAFGVFFVEIQDTYDVTSGAISWIPAIFACIILCNGKYVYVNTAKRTMARCLINDHKGWWIFSQFDRRIRTHGMNSCK